jgi:hypothetical protein
MYLNIAGDKRLETYEECLAHLQKFKDDGRMALVVERILERNNYLNLYTDSNRQIKSLQANRYLYPVGNLLAAYRTRLADIEASRMPLGWVTKTSKK